MIKEDLDELIAILEENSAERLATFYNKIGIDCVTAQLYDEKLRPQFNRQLEEKIVINKDVLRYFMTQYKNYIGMFLDNVFTQESNLEEILEIVLK